MLGLVASEPKQDIKHQSIGDEIVKGGAWRRRVSDVLLSSGGLILLSVALLWIQSTISTRQLYDWRYLVSDSSRNLPVLILPQTPTPRPIAVVVPESSPTAIIEGPPLQTSPTPTESVSPTPSEIPTLEVTPLIMGIQATQNDSAPVQIGLALPIVARNELPTPTSTPMPDTGRVVRLVIPRVKVDRAVVLVGLRKDAEGRLQWDTDRLFATRNRLDLVGQLNNAFNPGQGGNVVLVGHNYDQGVFIWEGVFINLRSVLPGDQVIVYTEGGGEYSYIVQQVKKVPWQEHNKNEMQKHMKYMGPSETERLTLMTCSGANIWPWPARLYVIAAPVSTAAQ